MIKKPYRRTDLDCGQGFKKENVRRKPLDRSSARVRTLTSFRASEADGTDISTDIL